MANDADGKALMRNALRPVRALFSAAAENNGGLDVSKKRHKIDTSLRRVDFMAVLRGLRNNVLK